MSIAGGGGDDPTPPNFNNPHLRNELLTGSKRDAEFQSGETAKAARIESKVYENPGPLAFYFLRDQYFNRMALAHPEDDRCVRGPADMRV